MRWSDGDDDHDTRPWTKSNITHCRYSPLCSVPNCHPLEPVHMQHRCAETARKYETKTRCLYPSPNHLKERQKRRFVFRKSTSFQVRKTTGKHTRRKQRLPAVTVYGRSCVDMRINECNTAGWQNIRLLMCSLWNQEIHYETWSRVASNTAAISSNPHPFLPLFSSSFELQHPSSNTIREVTEALNRMQQIDADLHHWTMSWWIHQ